MNKAKKSAEKNTTSPAENKTAPADEVKTETKTAASPAKSTGRTKTEKPAKTATKTKTASKPETAVAEKTESKPVAKTAAKSATKPAAKRATAKPAAEKAAADTAATTDTAPAKRGGRKPKPVTIDVICEKIAKKISKTKAAAVTGTIAADIEVWGFADGSNAMMYIEIKDGKVTVSPHNYEDNDFRVSLSYANAVAFADGKIDIKELVASNDFYAEGKIVEAVKFAAIF